MNKLKSITVEQAGFRAGRSTTNHIFNLRIICEITSNTNKTSFMSLLILRRHLKGFGMLPCGQPCGYITSTQTLSELSKNYEQTSSPVLLNGKKGDCTTVGLHTPLSTSSLKGLWKMPKNTQVRIAKFYTHSPWALGIYRKSSSNSKSDSLRCIQ